MQFDMIEIESPVGTVAKCALILIFVILIVLIHHTLVLRAKYRRFRIYARDLGSLIGPGLETGKWDLVSPPGPDDKVLPSSASFGAWREELPGKGPLALAGIIGQAWGLLAGPLTQLVHRLRYLGLGACLLGLLGGLSDMQRLFHFMARSDAPSFNYIVWTLVAADILLLLYGLAVGLACLAVSGFFQDRMQSLIISASKPISAVIANTRT